MALVGERRQQKRRRPDVIQAIANSLRCPALCLAELASAMAKQDGTEPLAAGDLISSGTLTESTPIQPGATWTASVEGIALSTLTLTLV
jgi:2-keto-4-pentenoate hydratase